VRSSPGVERSTVLRDTSGSITRELEQSIDDGRELLIRGRSIVGGSSPACWRDARQRWSCRTTGTLTAHFAPEAVLEFRRANDEQGAAREGSVDDELSALQNAIELLRSLAGTLRV
jgi:hypothetical protein